MANPWNKGFTKETHPSVRKISDTMRNKRIDNFYAWREGMKKFGKIKSDYPWGIPPNRILKNSC